MKRDIKFRLLALAVVFSLTLSILGTTTVFADDTVPPATEEPVSTAEPAETSSEEDVALEAAPDETGDVIVSNDEPSETEGEITPDTESAETGMDEAPITLPQVLDQLSQDTNVVVVVDEEVEPLVTQAAANAFVAGDPIWCEDGIAPDPGQPGCTGSYGNLFSLISDIAAGTALNFDETKDGTIWIMGNDSSGSAVVIDDLTFWGWSASSLTLQGGWDGTDILGSNILPTPSVFNVPISIVNWDGNITINNIEMDGANGIGLDLQTSGNVTLDDVTSSNNDRSGIFVSADGDVILQDVSASGNGAGFVNGNGADITSNTGNVTLIGSNYFENNLETGLVASANIDISAENINANGNGNSGGSLTTSTGNVDLSGDNTFNDNLGGSGLLVNSSDDIVIDSDSFSANNNGVSGADLDAVNDVSLLGTANIFDGNLGGSGLLIDVFGNISINSDGLSASSNSASGADLTAGNNVSILGSANVFNGNLGGSGLLIDASGNIVINSDDLSASNNNGRGADLAAGNSVSLTGLANTFNGNLGGGGLVIDSSNNIVIDSDGLSASNNSVSGADLTAGNNVSILGSTNVFNGNLGGSGLLIDAFGNISINSDSLSASSNSASGADLTAGNTVSILGSANVFNGNLGGSGLLIDASGSIDINSDGLSASNNSASGADLTAVNTVSLLGTANAFNGNGTMGLLVATDAGISLENITANNNAAGAVLNLMGGLTMTGVNVFNNNDGTGLYVDAIGDVSAENITAIRNGIVNGSGGGAEIYTSGGFFLGGSNVFRNNRDSGLFADVDMDIIASNITANSNGYDGAEFYTRGNFTLSGLNTFNENMYDGLFVDSNGFIDIDNIAASSNGGHGISLMGNEGGLINCGSTIGNFDYEIQSDLPGTLTLVGVNFDGEAEDKLDVNGPLVLVSSGCFRYPAHFFAEEDDDTNRADIPTPDPIKIQTVNVTDQQTVELDCKAYGGTRLTTPGGGIYIPCPIETSARLRVLTPSALPSILTNGEVYVSGLDFSVLVDPSGEISSFGTQVIQWKGESLVESHGIADPFISVFFSPPSGWTPEKLAILYWDGVSWVELSDAQYFGDGRVTQKVGFTADGYFTAIVNFTGVFALVQK